MRWLLPFALCISAFASDAKVIAAYYLAHPLADGAVTIQGHAGTVTGDIRGTVELLIGKKRYFITLPTGTTGVSAKDLATRLLNGEALESQGSVIHEKKEYQRYTQGPEKYTLTIGSQTFRVYIGDGASQVSGLPFDEFSIKEIGDHANWFSVRQSQTGEDLRLRNGAAQ